MTQIDRNRIFFKENWGFFIGSFSDNFSHKHYAIQISIALKSAITLTDENNNNYSFENFIVKSNTKHHLKCEKEHFLLLLNPISTIGHYLQQFSKDEISEFNNSMTKELQQFGLDFISGRLDFKDLILKITKLLEIFICECESSNHLNDNRIEVAIKYLEDNFDRVVPIEEIAEKCYLSPSRFLHLFKEKTGITYRKVQQWHKVSKSFKILFDQNITKTAHQVGFSDSAHFTKVFKETFGFNPKTIKKC